MRWRGSPLEKPHSAEASDTRRFCSSCCFASRYYSGVPPSGRRRRPGRRAVWTPTPNATQAADSQPTSAVNVIVTAQEQGAIADGNTRLAMQVTITNIASKPIEIVYRCGYEPIQFAVWDMRTNTFISGSDTYSCPPGPSRLYPLPI